VLYPAHLSLPDELLIGAEPTRAVLKSWRHLLQG